MSQNRHWKHCCGVNKSLTFILLKKHYKFQSKQIFFLSIFYQYKHFAADFQVFWDPEMWCGGENLSWKSHFWLGNKLIFFQQKNNNSNEYKYNIDRHILPIQTFGTDFHVFSDPEYYNRGQIWGWKYQFRLETTVFFSTKINKKF